MLFTTILICAHNPKYWSTKYTSVAQSVGGGKHWIFPILEQMAYNKMFCLKNEPFRWNLAPIPGNSKCGLHQWKCDFQKCCSAPYVVGCLSRGIDGTSSKQLRNLIFVKLFGRKVSKIIFYFCFEDSGLKIWFWDFSPKRFDENEISQLFWALAINTSR